MGWATNGKDFHAWVKPISPQETEVTIECHWRLKIGVGKQEREDIAYLFSALDQMVAIAQAARP
jgi:hypothetical protein